MCPMSLGVCGGAHHLVLVFGGVCGGVVLRALERVSELGVRGVRRFVIHVVTPLPRPLYLEGLRPLLQSVISYTLVIRYCGSSVGDLGRLVGELANVPKDFIVSSDLSEFAEFLKGLGIEYYTA